MKELILNSLTPEEFKELIQGAIRETLAIDSHGTKKTDKQNLSNLDNDPFLTRKQTADLLQISLPTLHQYTKGGLITSYRIGNKVRYKNSDVKNALTERNYGRRAS